MWYVQNSSSNTWTIWCFFDVAIVYLWCVCSSHPLLEELVAFRGSQGEGSGQRSKDLCSRAADVPSRSVAAGWGGSLFFGGFLELKWQIIELESHKKMAKMVTTHWFTTWIVDPTSTSGGSIAGSTEKWIELADGGETCHWFDRTQPLGTTRIESAVLFFIKHVHNVLPKV